MSPYPELDEEIDFLSVIINEQRPESKLSGIRRTTTYQYLLSAKRPRWGADSALFAFLVVAPFSQDLTSKQFNEPGYTNRASSTEQTFHQSILLTSVAPPTTTNRPPALLSNPIILHYPSDDHVFISKSSFFLEKYPL